MSYQRALSNFILHDDSANLTALFDETADLSIASIYKNGFFRSCRGVLASTFPSAESFAGKDLFKALTQAFIKEHPPHKSTLTGYGKQFPTWLADQSIIQNPELSQIAMLDWSWIACLHGDNATPLTAELFQTQLADKPDSVLASISVLENMQFQKSNKKAWNLWLNLKKQNQNFELDSATTEQQQLIIMWRPSMEVFARALPADEFDFICEIADSQDINKASEHVLNKYPDFNLPEQFSNLLHHGLLTISREKYNV